MGELNLIYDLECWPNLFTATFKEYGHDRTWQFVVWENPDGSGDDINETAALTDFILQEVKRLVGYNSLHYDNLLLNYLLINRELMLRSTARRITSDLRELSGRIIYLQDSRKRKDEEDAESTEEEDPLEKAIVTELHTLSNITFFTSLDMIAQFNTVDRTGLKQVAINLKWHNVQDLPFPVDHICLREDIAVVLDYNLNDVLITEYMLKERSEVIVLRDHISKRYGVDVYNNNDTDIGKALITKYYLEETKIPMGQFLKGRSFYSSIALKECITHHSISQLYSREAGKLVKFMCKTRIDPNRRKAGGKKQFEYTYRSRYITHTIGLGGIHSINPPEIITETEDHWLLDIDVSGYYGSLIVEEKLYPRHLGPAFTKVFRERVHLPKLQAKASGDELAAETLKLASNSIFGLTKSIHSPFYDPRMTTTICISGELYLITLIEAIESCTGAVVVYSNTDGLRIRLPRSEYNAVLQVCKLWESDTGFALAYKRLRKIILKDVNNYLLFTYNEGKPVNAAGDFKSKRPISKGYDYPIIPTALNRFYDTDVPIEETINNTSDLFLYMKAEKVSQDKFYAELRKKNGEVMRLQKHNRWLVTDGNPEEGKLYKVDRRPDAKVRQEEMQKGYFTTVANLLPKDNIPVPEEMKVNYSFYINEALKIINIIKPSTNRTHVQPDITQLGMFS